MPSEIINQSAYEWSLNTLITSIGRLEEHKENLVSALKSYNQSVNENTSIERLEKLLEQQRKKANA